MSDDNTAADMTDNDTVDEVDNGSEDRTAPETKSDFKPITSQAELDALLKGRLTRAEKSVEKKFQKQIEELTSKIQGYEDEKLSAQEKLEKRIQELTAALAERDKTIAQKERDALVTSLAADNNLPRKFWDRVRGETEEEIAADIQELLEALPAAQQPNQGPPSRSSTVTLQSTGDDAEADLSAEAILEAINPRYKG